MGAINSYINQDNIQQVQKTVNEQNLNLIILKSDLDIDFKSNIHPTFMQLKNWSLHEIRTLYLNFRGLQKTPFVNKPNFKHIMNFSNKTSEYLFQIFGKKEKYINIFEFLSMLTILAHANYIQKVHKVIFLMFDLDASENLSLDEIISVFISCINGYAKFSNQTPPEHMNVIYYAKIMFLKSDVQTDNTLNVRELLDWIDSNSLVYDFFQKFEPGTKVKQNVGDLQEFSPYNEQECNQIHNLMKMYQENQKHFYEFWHKTQMRMDDSDGPNIIPNHHKTRNGSLHHFPQINKNVGRSSSITKLFQQARGVMDIANCKQAVRRIEKKNTIGQIQENNSFNRVDEALGRHSINFKVQTGMQQMTDKYSQQMASIFQLSKQDNSINNSRNYKNNSSFS